MGSTFTGPDVLVEDHSKDEGSIDDDSQMGTRRPYFKDGDLNNTNRSSMRDS